MEIQSSRHTTAADFMLLSLLVDAAILAHQSLLLLIFQFPATSVAFEAISGQTTTIQTSCEVGSLRDDRDAFQDSVRTDQRFPMSELNKGKEPDAENNDAGEPEDDDSDDDEDVDDEDSDDNDEDDGNDSEEDSDDDEEDSDDEVEANGNGENDDEDDDEDDDGDDDDEDDDDEEDEDDEDDEELNKLPSERKKVK
ncbi:uncharacterized protein [Malus domestica]|uniref:uncharacterized protein isoform X2 n=1 Tax=Malus domestica TaxID=3750 RepID=UPI0039766B07